MVGFFTRDPDVIERFAWRFKWTPLHHSAEELKPLRHSYDEVATNAVARLDEIEPPAPAVYAPKGNIQEAYVSKEKRLQRDLFKLVKQHADDDEQLGKLWQEVNTVPEWVDWEQIERGQNVFWRYGLATVTALTYLSLLGGMASGRPVETLDRTGGFGAEVVRRRLLETTQHTLGVHRDLASIKPGGDGWEASVRIRLLHSSVRRRIINLAHQHPSYYDTAKYGVPINDLDSIGTVVTFSSTIIWLGLPRQGIHLREHEVRDFLALWRYVAYLIGTPHDWLATTAGAKAMMESLMMTEYAPTEASSVLANNIIMGLEGMPPVYASRGFLNALTWRLNGRELAQDLKIEEPSLYHRGLVVAQSLLFMMNAYICRNIPSLDEWNRNRIRNRLYRVLVEDKSMGGLGYKAMFSFKWIPDLLNVSTPLGSRNPAQARESGAFMNNGVERSALVMLVLMVAGFGFLVRGVSKAVISA